MPNTTFGRYVVIRTLGEGGMSTVYLAHDPSLGREVAIKVLKEGSTNNPQFAARFQREALAIAKLEHPAILPIYDFGAEQGLNYIVIRLLSGGTLEERLQSSSLTLTEVVSILQPIASALDFSHSKGVLHRDIKPSNIGFNENGSPLLMDFGLASLARGATRLTTAGSLLGTPTYMAPEQVMGNQLDGRADIYALGIVAFEALTGQVPFSGVEALQVAYAHVNQPVPKITSLRPELPKAADEIFLKVLAKDPARRYSSASAFVEALEQIATRVPAHDRPQQRTIANVIRDKWQVFSSAIVTMLEQISKDRIPHSPPQPPRKPPPPPPPILPLPLPTPSSGGSRPSMILRPQVHNLLAPIAHQTIKDLMSHLEPERIVNYAVVFGGGRFIITGYGSFGGTSLIQEICQLIEQEWTSSQTDSNHKILMIQLNSQDMLASDHSVFKASIRRGNFDSYPIGTFAKTIEGTYPGLQPLSALFDPLTNINFDPKDKSPIPQKIRMAFDGKASFGRLVLTIDKVVDWEAAEFILAHPLFESHQATLITVVESEDYNRWPNKLRKQLHTQLKFQYIYIPCLWESDSGLVESTMDLLFSRFQMETPEASEKFQAFKKHIAYLGRGQTGTMLYELRQLRYWKIDKASRQAFIMLDALDDALIRQHAWIQELLDANWDHILGTSFQGQERTDRAKQGIYSLMDWIIDSSTFTLEEILAEASQRPVWISSYKRLRDEVVVRLLDILVKNNYLKRIENEFDIIWGRDVTDEVVSTVGHTTYADRVSVLHERMDELMDEYKAANEQLSGPLNEVERTRLKRQIDRIESDMEEIQKKLDSI